MHSISLFRGRLQNLWCAESSIVWRDREPLGKAVIVPNRHLSDMKANLLVVQSPFDHYACGPELAGERSLMRALTTDPRELGKACPRYRKRLCLVLVGIVESYDGLSIGPQSPTLFYWVVLALVWTSLRGATECTDGAVNRGCRVAAPRQLRPHYLSP